MARPHRLDFHGAIHLVQMRGKEGFNIYFGISVPEIDVSADKKDTSALGRSFAGCRRMPHLRRFLALLDACCSESGAQLFGYCIEPNRASLVLRILGAPLEAFMQRLGGRYSRYLHAARVLPNRTAAYAARYESKLVAPEYLPHAIRHVHVQPLRSGLARRAIDYPFSSAAVYVGERAPLHLETDALWRALERKGLFGLRGYREFMEKAETPHVAELFAHGSAFDARVVGGQVFVAQARDAAGHPPAPLSRERLFAGVSKLLGTNSETFFGDSHQGVLARALAAWHALRSGSASVREVATWFGVTAATLGRGIRHYRRVSPALFEQALPGIETDDREMEN